MNEAFGDYTLIRKLGTGGTAEVFLARRAGASPQVVVLKRLLPHLSRKQKLVELFLNEARIAGELHHPNIARVYDAGRVGVRDYIAMEFVPGPDLGRLIARCGDHPITTLGFGPLVQMMCDVCDALHHAHEEGHVVHGDVHPRNVMLTLHGAPKVIDFGVARATHAAGETQPRGTYAYMAPEQLKGEGFDRRSDVFALGVVMWEIVAGRSLFKRSANYLTLTAVVEDAAPPAHELVPSAAKAGAVELDRVLQRALAKSPDDRHASCAELAAELRAVAEARGWDASATTLARAVNNLFPRERAELTREVGKTAERTVDAWIASLDDSVDIRWLLD